MIEKLSRDVETTQRQMMDLSGKLAEVDKEVAVISERVHHVFKKVGELETQIDDSRDFIAERISQLKDTTDEVEAAAIFKFVSKHKTIMILLGGLTLIGFTTVGGPLLVTNAVKAELSKQVQTIQGGQ